MDQWDLIEIYRILLPKKSEYTFFSNAHMTLSRIDQILGHKTNSNLKEYKLFQACFLTIVVWN